MKTRVRFELFCGVDSILFSLVTMTEHCIYSLQMKKIDKSTIELSSVDEEDESDPWKSGTP